MYINPNWRILTIGDGDFSFSLALSKLINPVQITATIYDSEETLNNKYQTHKLLQLKRAGVQVLTDFDVTDKSTWQGVKTDEYDLVIFQFPLVPAFASAKKFRNSLSVNTLNRALLRAYLRNCFDCFLNTNGAKLAYITSKDVKPYIEWNIEHTLIDGLDINYIGKMEFDFDHFPEYQIRNVDRDKHVKQTAAFTHVWGKADSCFLTLDLIKPKTLSGDHCSICQAGPFETLPEKQSHMKGKRHVRMAEFEAKWQMYLQSEFEQTG